MKNKYLVQLIFIISFLSLGINAQKQRITDVTSSALEFKKSVELNGFIYTVGQSTTSNYSYPTITKQSLDLDPDNTSVKELRRFTPNAKLFLSQIAITSDGNIVVSGTFGDNSAQAPIWVIKMNPSLVTLWGKEIKSTSNNSAFQEPNDMFANDIGGVTILATEYFAGSDNVQVVNLNAAGNIDFSKKVEAPFGQVQGRKEPIGYWKNNNELIVIVRDVNYSEIITLNASGSLISSKEFINSTNEKVSVSNTAKDASFTYYVGRMTESIWTSVVIKVDNSGSVIWSKNFTGLSVINTIAIKNNGTLLVSGQAFFGSLANKLVVLELDQATGNVTSNEPRAYGKVPANHLVLDNPIEVNGNYLFSGSRIYQNISTGYQLLINSSLESFSCYESNVFIPSVSLNITFGSASSTVSVNNLSLNLQSGTTPFDFPITPVQYDLVNNIQTTITTTSDLCNGTPNGTAMITATGGEAPYTHSWWVNDYANNDPTESVSNLDHSKEHNVTTHDLYGCYTYDTVDIQPGTIAPEICMVTVDETSSKNVVVWEKDINNPQNIQNYNIYRNVAGNYSLVGSKPFSDSSFYEDNTNGVNPNITSYRYILTAVASCASNSGSFPVESEIDENNAHETIHMTVTQNAQSQPFLIWDGYEGHNFLFYRVLRDSTNTGDWEVVDAAVPSANFTWTDIDAPTTPTRYMVEVILDPCSPEKADTYGSTRSNRSTGGGVIFQTLSAAFSETNTVIQAGEGIVYTDNSFSSNGGIESRTWEFEGGNPNIGVNQTETVIYNTPGSYSVKLTVYDSISSDVIEKIGLVEVGVSGIENISAFKAVTVFPNPTKDNLTVLIDVSKDTEVIAELYSLEGKLIEAKTKLENNNINFNFNLSEKSKGVYLLKLMTAEGEMIRKVVKN